MLKEKEGEKLPLETVRIGYHYFNDATIEHRRK
jgi:hypothetical protein